MFGISINDTRTIQTVSLISLGAVTHSHNNDQRLQKAAFSQSGNVLTVSLPSNANLLPPGWYMLHVVDSAGVPSRGYIVEVKKP